VMPFVVAGLDRREPVLAVVCPETRRQLERLLGRRADRIELHEAAEWYAAPASTLEQFERYADMPREGRARIVATLAPGPASTVPAAEWTRLEAQLDAGLADRALSMLCVYDAATLPGELLRDAHRTHPVVRDGRRPADAPAYLTGPELLRELDAIGLPEPPVPAEHRPLDADLRDLRTHVLARARTAGLGVRRRQQLLLAVQEAARVVLDGGPAHSRLRSWIHEDTLVFELRGDDRRVGRRPVAADRGRDPDDRPAGDAHGRAAHLRPRPGPLGRPRAGAALARRAVSRVSAWRSRRAAPGGRRGRAPAGRRWPARSPRASRRARRS